MLIHHHEDRDVFKELQEKAREQLFLETGVSSLIHFQEEGRDCYFVREPGLPLGPAKNEEKS